MPPSASAACQRRQPLVGHLRRARLHAIVVSSLDTCVSFRFHAGIDSFRVHICVTRCSICYGAGVDDSISARLRSMRAARRSRLLTVALSLPARGLRKLKNSAKRKRQDRFAVRSCLDECLLCRDELDRSQWSQYQL